MLCVCNQHLKNLQNYWCTMDDIDKALWVVDPTKPSYAMSHRRIALGNLTYLFDLIMGVSVFFFYCCLKHHMLPCTIRWWLLYITACWCTQAQLLTRVSSDVKFVHQGKLIIINHKQKISRCRFLGTDGKLERLIKNWRKNRKRWYVLRLPTVQ